MHPVFRAFAAASVLGTATAALPLQAQERFTLPGSEVTIHNIAGTLQVVAGSGSSTEVEVTRIGRDSRELRVVPGTSGSVSTLRVIYPRDEIVYPRMGHSSQTTFDVRDDGTFGGGIRGDRRVQVSSSDRASTNAMEAGADLVVRVPAGVRLTTYTAVGEAQLTGVRGTFNINTFSGPISATGTNGTLSLRASSGRISASDVEGDVTIRTSSGTVRLDNVRGTSVTARVSSGGIDADQVRAPTVELRTSSGRIRADEVQADRLVLASSSGSVHARAIAAGEARITTSSGSLEVDLAAPARVAELRAVSGSITLRVPQNMGARLDLRTTSGGIRVNTPMTNVTQRRGHTSGTIGDGSATVSARSTSGSVTVSAR